MFCDSGDTPANLSCELNGHLMPYVTRGTRSVQVWRSCELSVFGPLQLLLLAVVVFRWAMLKLDFSGEGKSGMGKGMGETWVEQQ